VGYFLDCLFVGFTIEIHNILFSGVFRRRRVRMSREYGSGLSRTSITSADMIPTSSHHYYTACWTLISSECMCTHTDDPISRFSFFIFSYIFSPTRYYESSRTTDDHTYSMRHPTIHYALSLIAITRYRKLLAITSDVDPDGDCASHPAAADDPGPYRYPFPRLDTAQEGNSKS
jgi:hypothetical protein